MNTRKKLSISTNRWLEICAYVINNQKTIRDLLLESLEPEMLCAEVWIDHIPEGELGMHAKTIRPDYNKNQIIAMSVSNLSFMDLIYMSNKLKTFGANDILSNIDNQVDILD